MARKPYQTPWLSEQEIGDKLWADADENFLAISGSVAHREVAIGNGRVDFASFNPGVIDLYELKITANINSVIQVVKYQRDLNEYLRQTYYYGNVDHTKCPKVATNLIARYFDVKIIELCAEFNISRWRVEVDELGNVSMELDEDQFFPVVPGFSPCVKLVTDYYGRTEVPDGQN